MTSITYLTTPYTHLATVRRIILRNVAGRIFYQPMMPKYIMAKATGLEAESFMSRSDMIQCNLWYLPLDDSKIGLLKKEDG
jgi:hypothetical protein